MREEKLSLISAKRWFISACRSSIRRGVSFTYCARPLLVSLSCCRRLPLTSSIFCSSVFCPCSKAAKRSTISRPVIVTAPSCALLSPAHPTTRHGHDRFPPRCSPYLLAQTESDKGLVGLVMGVDAMERSAGEKVAPNRPGDVTVIPIRTVPQGSGADDRHQALITRTVGAELDSRLRVRQLAEERLLTGEDEQIPDTLRAELEACRCLVSRIDFLDGRMQAQQGGRGSDGLGRPAVEIG